VWTPQEIRQLVATTTGCLCVMVVVLGTMLALMTNKITPELLGKISTVGVGSGLAGLGLIGYMVIRVGLGLHGDNKRGRR
jgi:hypothetical protein